MAPLIRAVPRPQRPLVARTVAAAAAGAAFTGYTWCDIEDFMMNESAFKAYDKIPDLKGVQGSTTLGQVTLESLYDEFASVATRRGMVSKGVFYKVILAKVGAEDLAVCDALFQLADKDGNGSIDFKEFIAAASLYLGGDLGSKSKTLFTIFDMDKNGSLDKFELNKLLKFQLLGALQDKTMAAKFKASYNDRYRMFHGLDTKAMIQLQVNQIVEEVFAAADKNHDGVLSFDEFNAFCSDPKNKLVSFLK